MSEPQVLIDDRYRGHHGIARYSSEVISRLDVNWSGMGLHGKPGSPFDAFRKPPRSTKADLIYSPGYAGFLSRRRQLLTLHDLIHLQADWPGRIKYLAYYDAVIRPAVLRSRAVFTVSESSRTAIREWLRDDDIEIVNTGNGCSEVFTREGPRRIDGPYVLFVGNTRAHKNVETLVSAVAQMKDLRLVVLVPRAEHEKFSDLAQARGLASERLELLAQIPDSELAENYRGAVATVVPSLLEGFGLPALESIRCGTPVVFWQGCSPVSEIVDWRGVSVEDPFDWEELHSAIDSILRSGLRVPDDTRDWSWPSVAVRVNEAISRLA